MKKLLSVIFAMVIALPALAMNVSITVIDENNETLIGASVIIVDTQTGAATDTNGHATLQNVPNDAQIRVSYVGYEEKIVPAQPTMSVQMTPSSTILGEVVVTACNISNGVKTMECKNCTDPAQCTPARCSGRCVLKECYTPCYKQKGNECELQSIDGGAFAVINRQCSLTCLSIAGYVQDPTNQWKCTQDCTSSMTDPHVKKARYRGNRNPEDVKCEIVECKGSYHPSDDGQSCIPNQGDCTPEQLAAVHAETGYLLTQQNKCVPQECLKPQYKPEGRGDNRRCVDQVGKPCNVKHAKSAKYEMQNGELVCIVVECDTANGYTKSSDNRSCSKDCLTTIQSTVPLATKAEYNSTGKCIIKKCGKQNGKKYIPSDDGQTCEETERDCDKVKDSAIWPEHATTASYKKSKTGSTAKCHATECEDGFDPDGGKCISVNDSDCDKKPENSKKSHRYYDASTQKTLCIIDECKNGYKVSNDMLSCILESALSEEDARKRMDELKENAQKMKEREQSLPNKLLGAAGIGAVGIGGMNIASALSEQSADAAAEQDMRAYLATFRCDYGQGRNIVGGEKNVQLPGASELIQYTTEYKQLATNLKADKEALGMLPGIESEVVFDSATTGLYDDVSIGTQKGAFTSLSRALLDENSADAAEWQAMKDKTAKKLKTGAIVAGVGAVGTLAGNLAINHDNGDQSGNILDKWEPQKQEIPDITLERIPCSNFPGTTGTGYVPNCECTDTNAYFDEQERRCIACDKPYERVNDTRNGCTCQNGYSRDMYGNCVANKPDINCNQFTTYGVDGGTYPTCKCKDRTNATFNPVTNKCECNAGYSDPDGDYICGPVCNGLHGVNNATAHQYNVPNCPCEYTGATFDTTRNGCYCPQGQLESTENGQKKCVSALNPIQPINPIQQPLFAGNFSSDETFDRSAYEISNETCTRIIDRIKRDQQYQTNAQRSGTLYICAIGHTDTKWFRNTSGVEANRQKNQQLSERRARAMYNCINTNIRTLFPNATVGTSNNSVIGKNWQECTVQIDNRDTPSCRKVTLKIQATPCTNN